MLTIQKAADGENMTVSLTGRLDANSASRLEEELQRPIKKAKLLVFDLQGLQYISTGGLRVLLSAQKQMNSQGRMRLINAGEAVMRTMEVKGFEDVFRFSDGYDE